MFKYKTVLIVTYEKMDKKRSKISEKILQKET